MALALATLYDSSAAAGVLVQPYARLLSTLIAKPGNEAALINSVVAYHRVVERVLDGRIRDPQIPGWPHNPLVKKFLEGLLDVLGSGDRWFETSPEALEALLDEHHRLLHLRMDEFVKLAEEAETEMTP